MKIHVLKENLAKALGLTVRFTSNKAQLPVLSHVGLKVENKELFLLGTDAVIGIKLAIGSKVIEGGGVAVPGRVFFELIQTLPLGTVEIETTEKEEALMVRSGGVSARLQTMKIDEFPEIEGGGGVELGSFSLDQLQEVVERLGFVVSQDESRPVLTGIHWELARGRVVATDGYRLSLLDKILKCSNVEKNKKIEQKSLLVSGSVIQEAGKVMGDLSEKKLKVLYQENQKQLLIQGNGVIVTGRVLTGEFPRYESIVPKKSGVRLLFETEALEQAIKSVSIFARDAAHIVIMRLRSEEMEVSAKAAQVGENKVRVKYAKKEVSESESEGLMRVAFNSKYLMEYLSGLRSDRVWLGFSDELAPVLFEEEGEGGYKHVIMPMRIQDEASD